MFDRGGDEAVMADGDRAGVCEAMTTRLIGAILLAAGVLVATGKLAVVWQAMEIVRQFGAR